MSEFKVVRQTRSPQEIKEIFRKTLEGKKGGKSVKDKSVKDKIEISRSAEKLSESKESDKAKKSGEIKKRLYATAIKKVDRTTSTLLNLHSPRVVSAANSNGSTQASRESIFAKRVDAYNKIKYKIPGLTTIDGVTEEKILAENTLA